MDVEPSARPPRFDAFDPGLLVDPYPLYARLRRSPLCRGGPATWVVTRYADVATLLRDPRVGHAFPESLGRPERLLGARPNFRLPTIVSAIEPPDHTRLRGVMSRVLTPPRVRRTAERIRETVDELLEPALQTGRLDVLRDLASPLQVITTCDLVGVPVEDRAEVSSRGIALGRSLILFPFESDELGNGEADAAWLRGYVADLVALRRARPADDLVSELVAEADTTGEMSLDEVVDNVVFLFFAGFETSIHLMASGVANLLRHPDELARLRADPDLLGTAVDELARFDAPIQWIARVTGEPVEVGGRTVRAGRMLLLLLASANRDERRFPDPDRIDVGRRHNAHLSFGSGIHRCMGLLLARAQASVSLGRLLERCAELEPDGEAVVRPHPNLRGYASVPVGVRAR
ncbi:MAG: Putative cytochrome P450 hydroxylase [uncultured Pseudonocardia sp.]|uniref:Cytochrome P450 hydroxylase n=1 Tax=uncultured Pseudonocardia sp. TaxID=211455 RepID=A0A6J4QMG2_9PSEU|nr:MAG: Putative cytochrome P450 hydroxylase [uncultured Pseudonocardia sp.]